jgi:type IV pilus assembly protein PilV
MHVESNRRFAVSGAPRARLRGFSLVEVLVALVVLGVGLLGIAKLQGASFSNTSIASRRSLAALEADSLAASMHVNRGYWSQPDASGANITVQGVSGSTPTVSVASGAAPKLNTAVTAVAGGTTCTSTTTPCTVENMAAYDLGEWAKALQLVLPNYTAKVACGTGTPISCTINITWTENAVAVNSTEASAAASAASASATVNAFAFPTYTLYVYP